MLQQYLEVGKVTNIHGLNGEVKVQPWADSPDFLCRFKTLYVDEAHFPMAVQRARVHKNMVIIKFEGPTDVPSAMSLRGATLYIDRADANLPEGAFFLADIWRCGTPPPARCWEKSPTCSPCPPTTSMW